MTRARRGPLLIALLVTALPVAAQAQSVARIFQQYLNAEGGARALARVRSAKYEGSVEEKQGDTLKAVGHFTLILKAPNRFYSEMTLGAGTASEGFNGQSGWVEDGGLTTLTGSKANQLEAAARYLSEHFLKSKKEKVRLRLLGAETLGARPADRVEFTTPTGVKSEFDFDTRSHLIARTDAPLVANATETLYGDYRPVDGVMEPFRLEIHLARGETLFVSMARVVHEQAVEDAVFNFPSASNAPLPDIPALLEAADKNQKAIDALVDQYACRQTQEEYQVDAKGVVKTKSVKEYEVFYLGGDEVDRLVSKDGKELSQADQQKETDRVKKRVEEYERRERKKEEAAAQGKKPKDKGLGISDFLRLCLFTSPRRERFAGAKVIVFDFAPNPAVKPRNLNERVVQDLAGACWVDEQSKEIVRLEAHLQKGIKIAGGVLASLQKGSDFVFEQKKVNGEVWLPSDAEVHFGARVLLVKGFHVNLIIHYSDYKKFRVESVSKPAAGR